MAAGQAGGCAPDLRRSTQAGSAEHQPARHLEAPQSRRPMIRLGAAALVSLLLTACVPKAAVRMPGDAGMLNEQQAREQALAGTDHWTLQGRIAVSDSKNSGSG